MVSVLATAQQQQQQQQALSNRRITSRQPRISRIKNGRRNRTEDLDKHFAVYTYTICRDISSIVIPETIHHSSAGCSMVHESLHDSEGAQTDGGQLAQGHGDRTNNRDLEMFGLVDHGVVETGWGLIPLYSD